MRLILRPRSSWPGHDGFNDKNIIATQDRHSIVFISIVVGGGRLPTAPTQRSRDSVPNCWIGTIRSGRSNAPVMISIRGPSMRRKLRGVPQAAQKSRSAMEEERNAAGLPRVQAKSLRSMSAKDANGAPDAFWHIRQWQMLTLIGAADSAK